MNETTKELLTEFIRAEQYKKDYETIQERCAETVNSYIDNTILVFLRNYAPYFNLYSDNRREHIQKDEKDFYLYDGLLFSGQFTAENYQEKAIECFQKLQAVLQNPTNYPEQMTSFCEAYNTLCLIVQYRKEVLEDSISMETYTFQTQILRIEKKLSDSKDAEWAQYYQLLQNKEFDAFQSLLETEYAKAYCPGQVVYGSVQTENTAFLKFLSIPEHLSSQPVFLKAEVGQNAAFLYTEDENRCSDILESFLPGLFQSVSSSYAPNDFSLAFIESKSLKSTVCAQFCNRISTLSDDSGNQKYDYCLYQIRSTKEWERDSLVGFANSDSATERLIESLHDELTQRKAMNRLKEKTLTQYNAENPHETLPFRILVINTFSDLFSGNQAEEMYLQLKELIIYGGAYGFFVICVGKNTVVTEEQGLFSSEVVVPKYDLMSDFQNNKWNLDAPQVPVSLVENRGKDEALFSEWKRKCEKTNSLLLSELFSRDDVRKPSFYTDDGLISIPIGIADGKAYCLETDLKGERGVSAILTGTTGSGKTSLIRAWVMSGAYCYSPDQLQFYIIDFKSEIGSPDFDCFDQMRNTAYVPHVRFLSGRANPGQAHSLLQFVRSIINERSLLFTKYGCEKASSYRSRLYEEMKRAGCSDYASYYEKMGSLSCMPALPQIYVIIDEANSVFDAQSSDSELIYELGKVAKDIRSIGISIILAGQSNPLATSKEVSEHFGIRMALKTKEPAIFYRTFSSTDDNSLDRGFSFLGGQAGKMVIQTGNNRLSFVNTSYLPMQKMSEWACAIRRKYENAQSYQWIQMRPGSQSAVSADVLAQLFKNPNSVVNLDTMDARSFPVYVGLNSLSSLPFPMVLREPDDSLVSEAFSVTSPKMAEKGQRNNDPHNYCIYAHPEKQVKILWNMAFYMAYYLKKKQMPCHISMNYYLTVEHDRFARIIPNPGEIIFKQCWELADATRLTENMSSNTTFEDISEAFSDCFSAYQRRKSHPTDPSFTYLFCLAEANKWISALDNRTEIQTEPAVEVSKNEVSFSKAFLKQLKEIWVSEEAEVFDDCSLSEEEWDLLFPDLSAMTAEDVLQFVEPWELRVDEIPQGSFRIRVENLLEEYNRLCGVQEVSSKSVDSGKYVPHSAKEALRMVAELLKYGAEYNVYFIFSYSSVSELMSNNYDFIDLDSWKNMIEDIPNDRNACYCKKVEVRLWDFLEAPQWKSLLLEE